MVSVDYTPGQQTLLDKAFFFYKSEVGVPYLVLYYTISVPVRLDSRYVCCLVR